VSIGTEKGIEGGKRNGDNKRKKKGKKKKTLGKIRERKAEGENRDSCKGHTEPVKPRTKKPRPIYNRVLTKTKKTDWD